MTNRTSGSLSPIGSMPSAGAGIAADSGVFRQHFLLAVLVEVRTARQDPATKSTSVSLSPLGSTPSTGSKVPAAAPESSAITSSSQSASRSAKARDRRRRRRPRRCRCRRSARRRRPQHRRRRSGPRCRPTISSSPSSSRSTAATAAAADGDQIGVVVADRLDPVDRREGVGRCRRCPPPPGPARRSPSTSTAPRKAPPKKTTSASLSPPSSRSTGSKVPSVAAAVVDQDLELAVAGRDRRWSADRRRRRPPGPTSAAVPGGGGGIPGDEFRQAVAVEVAGEGVGAGQEDHVVVAVGDRLDRADRDGSVGAGPLGDDLQLAVAVDVEDGPRQAADIDHVGVVVGRMVEVDALHRAIREVRRGDHRLLLAVAVEVREQQPGGAAAADHQQVDVLVAAVEQPADHRAAVLAGIFDHQLEFAVAVLVEGAGHPGAVEGADRHRDRGRGRRRSGPAPPCSRPGRANGRAARGRPRYRHRCRGRAGSRDKAQPPGPSGGRTTDLRASKRALSTGWRRRTKASHHHE